MTCFNPLTAYRSKVANKSGKYPLVFNERDGYKDKKVTVNCGKCIGCRKEKARMWSIRLMHEASMHDEKCFITLTYNDENLPFNSSLSKKDYQLFMKRLRKKFMDKTIRFFGCGEYGDSLRRPHYHIMIFGLDLRQNIGYDMHMLESSPILQELWDKGFNTVGEVNEKTCNYIAGYVTKKLQEDEEFENIPMVNLASGEIIEEREKGFVTMSRKPGIGYGWYQKYNPEVYPSDSVLYAGYEVKPPRYYDNKHTELSPDLMHVVKLKRQIITENQKANQTPERLIDRERYQTVIHQKKIRRLHAK